MVSDGGDYWSLTVALEPGDYEYKYGAQIKNQDGTISDYWENDIPGASYAGGNRTLTVGSTDMVLILITLEVDQMELDLTLHLTLLIFFLEST